jgi:hypothetical protein
MPLHPVISLLLAAVFAAGSIMPPRHACVCVDGTVSVEVGRLFCEVSGGCVTNLNAIDEADRPYDTRTISVLEGCQSTPLADDAVVLIDRNERGDTDSLARVSPVMHPMFGHDPASWRLASTTPGTPELNGRSRSSDPLQLRSVILLV